MTVGCAILTVNGRLLNSNIGFLQTLSILGYSLTPLLIANIFILFLGFSNLLNTVVAIGSCVLSINASAKLVSCKTAEGKKPLVILPVILYQVT